MRRNRSIRTSHRHRDMIKTHRERDRKKREGVFGKTQPWDTLIGQPQTWGNLTDERQTRGTMFGQPQTWGNLTDERQQAKTLLGQPQTWGTMFSETLPSETMLGQYDTIEEELKLNWDNFIDYPNHRRRPDLPLIPREEGSKLKNVKNDQLLKKRIISLIKKPKYISPRYVLNISHEDDGYYTYIYDTNTDKSFWSTYNNTDGFRIARIKQQFDKNDRLGPLIPEFNGWKLLEFDDAFGIRNHKKKSKRRKKKSKRRGKKSKKKTKKRRVGKKSKKKSKKYYKKTKRRARRKNKK